MKISAGLRYNSTDNLVNWSDAAGVSPGMVPHQGWSGSSSKQAVMGYMTHRKLGAPAFLNLLTQNTSLENTQLLSAVCYLLWLKRSLL